MSQGIESGIGGLWFANQTALGSQAATAAASTKVRCARRPTTRYKSGKTHGREPYVDGAAFDSSTPYVEGVGGDIGQEVIQAQIENAARRLRPPDRRRRRHRRRRPVDAHDQLRLTEPRPQTIREKTGVRRPGSPDVLGRDPQQHDCGTLGHDQNVAHLSASRRSEGRGDRVAHRPRRGGLGHRPVAVGRGAGAVTINAVVVRRDRRRDPRHRPRLDDAPGRQRRAAYFVPGRGAITRTFSGAVTTRCCRRSCWRCTARRPRRSAPGRRRQPSFPAAEDGLHPVGDPDADPRHPEGRDQARRHRRSAQAAGRPDPRRVRRPVRSPAAPPMITVTAKTGDSVSYITAP
jgi:hypothetical protein